MVLDQLNQLIPGSVFNKHQCCREGAIAIILSVLDSSQTEQTYLGQDVEGWQCSEGWVFYVFGLWQMKGLGGGEEAVW